MSLIRRGETHGTPMGGEGHVTTEAETAGVCPKPGNTGDGWSPPGAGRGRRNSPPEPPESVWPQEHLHMGFWPPELGENPPTLLEALRLWSFMAGALPGARVSPCSWTPSSLDFRGKGAAPLQCECVARSTGCSPSLCGLPGDPPTPGPTVRGGRHRTVGLHWPKPFL